MKNNEPEYQELRRLVEETSGHEIRTPKDFNLLVLRIFDRTNVLLSSTTLKRFWGYIDKDKSRQETRHHA